MPDLSTSPEFQRLAASSPKAAAIALRVDGIATDTVRPLLNRFDADNWPPEFRAIVINAVIEKLIRHLKGTDHG